MTGEAEDKTTAWCTENGVAYPFGYEPSGALFKQLKCRGYPSAVLVNPKGEVVWSGHPGTVNASLIEKYIAGAETTPVNVRALTKAWPANAAPIKLLVAKGQLGKAMAAANTMASKDDACKVVVESLSQFANDQIEEIRALHKKGDLLGALVAAEAAGKTLAGFPQGGEADAIGKQLKSDKKAAEVIKAQRAIAKIEAGLGKLKKRKQINTAVLGLRKIANSHSDNFAGAAAERLIEKLEALGARLGG